MLNLECLLFLSLGKGIYKSHIYPFQVQMLFHQCLCSRTGAVEAEETHLERTEEGVFCFLPWAL